MRESYENYLKAIYLISKKKKGGWVSNSEISNFLEINPSSVTEMLHKLKNDQLINWSPRKSIRLSEKGRIKAGVTIEKNTHLREFFKTVLKVKDPDLLKKLCCDIEHHITDDISKSLRELVLKNT